MKKRILSLVLAMVMVMSLFTGVAVTASAAVEPAMAEKVGAIFGIAKTAINSTTFGNKCEFDGVGSAAIAAALNSSSYNAVVQDDEHVVVDDEIMVSLHMTVRGLGDDYPAEIGKEGLARVILTVYPIGTVDNQTETFYVTIPALPDTDAGIVEAAMDAILAAIPSMAANSITQPTTDVKVWFETVLAATDIPRVYVYVSGSAESGDFVGTVRVERNNASVSENFTISGIKYTTDLDGYVDVLAGIDDITLTVEAVCEGYTGNLQYQWYSNTDRYEGGTPIDGATGKSYHVGTLEEGKHCYYCMVTADNGVKKTSTITQLTAKTLSVVKVSSNITNNSTSSIAVGYSYTLEFTARSNPAGKNIAYQWYCCGNTNNKENATPIDGATGSSFTVPSDEMGTLYYFCRAYVDEEGLEGYYLDSGVKGVIVYKSYNVVTADTADDNGDATVDGGKYSVNPTCAGGGTCYVDVEPDDGYTVDTVTAYKTSDPSVIAYSGSNTSFKMPEYDVTVKVTFKVPTPITAVDLQVDWSRVPTLANGDDLIEAEWDLEDAPPVLFVDGVGVEGGSLYGGWAINVTEAVAARISTATGIPADMWLEFFGYGTWISIRDLNFYSNTPLSDFAVEATDELAILAYVNAYDGYFPATETGAYDGTVTCNAADTDGWISRNMGELNNRGLVVIVEAGTVAELTAKKNAAEAGTRYNVYYDFVNDRYGYTVGGSYGVMPGIATANTDIVVRVTPNNGYEVDKVTWQTIDESNAEGYYEGDIVIGGETATAVTEVEGVYSFKMPASDVIVKVTFKQKALSAEEKVAAAKEAIQKAINELTATNDTTEDSIQTIVNNALNQLAGIDGVTAVVALTTNTDATTEAAGSVVGSVSITCGDESDSVAINKTIEKLAPVEEEPYVIGLDLEDLVNAKAGVYFYDQGVYGNVSAKETLFDASETVELKDNSDSAVVEVYADEGYAFVEAPVVTVNGGNAITAEYDEFEDSYIFKIYGFTGDSTIKVTGAAVAPAADDSVISEVTVDIDWDKITYNEEGYPELTEENILLAPDAFAEGVYLDWGYYDEEEEEWLSVNDFADLPADAKLAIYVWADLAEGKSFADSPSISCEDGTINEYQFSGYDIEAIIEIGTKADVEAIIGTFDGGEDELNYEIETNIPGLDADGLDEEADAIQAEEAAKEENVGQDVAVNVKLTVEAKTSDVVDPDEKAEIQEVASTQSETLTYLDIVIKKTVIINGVPQPDARITTTKGLISIEVPFETANKKDFKVYRYHDGEVHTLTESDDETVERIIVGDGTITIMAKNFSTYAIGYTVTTGSNTPDYPFIPVIPYNPPVVNTNDVTTCNRGTTCPMHPYVDVNKQLWYHHGVHYCVENGLMTGISATEFAPNMETSRAMIVTILWRMENKPVVNYAMTFKDVAADMWYTEAIRWAQSVGIVEGYNDDAYGPNDSITREQLASILWRYAKYKGYDVSVGENTNILSYADAFDVSSWAMPAMQWACGAGLINGIAMNNTMYLVPQGDAVRAQSATVIYYFCTEVKK